MAELDIARQLLERLDQRTHILAARLEDDVRRIESRVAEQSALTRATVQAPARDAAMAQLLGGLDLGAALRPGLSVLVISWNHAGFLPAAVQSGLAALDGLPANEQGRVLVLDDASTDETGDVLADLVAQDERVESIRSPVNLGLSRARNVLLQRAATTHALVLDADNRAAPEGVATLYAVAREWRSAFTYGNVLLHRPDGSVDAVASNDVPSPGYFFTRAHHIDSLAIVAVGVVLEVGGYSLDPAFHAFDDHELVHRLARLGHLIGFVPTVVGRYRVDDLSHSSTLGHQALPPGRLARMYDQDGKLESTVAAFAAHPATGPVWATAAAAKLDPRLASVVVTS